MKKAMLNLFALMLMCSMAAFAQDTMKSDDSSKKAASSDKMGKAVNVKGWVSDEKCGAQGAKAGHVDCAKKCMADGKKVVFVGDKDKKVWAVENPEALAGHEGHHVKLSAHVDKDKDSIHVMSVSMLSQGKAKKSKDMDAMHDNKS